MRQLLRTPISVGAIEGAGEILLGANTLTITNGGASFAGVITTGGSGGIDIAGGTTTLSGTNTYGGATVISSAAGTATLALAGGSIATSSGVTVNSGGTLTGTGTTSGVTVNAGGTLAPGTSGAGTLTVNGKLMLNTGADYAASISSTNGTNSSDRRDRNQHGHARRNVHGCGRHRNVYSRQSVHGPEYGRREWRHRNVFRSHGHRQFRQCGAVPDLQFDTDDNVRSGAYGGQHLDGRIVELEHGGNWTGRAYRRGIERLRRTSPLSMAARRRPSRSTRPRPPAPCCSLPPRTRYTFNINGGGNSLTLNGIGVVDNSGIRQMRPRSMSAAAGR